MWNMGKVESQAQFILFQKRIILLLMKVDKLQMAYDTLSLNMDKVISFLEGGISEVEKELNKFFC